MLIRKVSVFLRATFHTQTVSKNMEKLKCPSCKKEYLDKIDTCKNCKFPFNGTEKERAIHIGQFINKKGVLIDSTDSIEKSQKILYAIAGINLIFLIIGFIKNSYQLFDLILNGIIVAVFLLCAFFIKKSPLILTIIPLILMIGIYTLNFIVEPRSIFNGIVVKLLIVGSLIYSIFLIKSADGFKKTYGVDE